MEDYIVRELTFDDVLITPAPISYVKSRKDVDLKTTFMGEECYPICSANMDSITGKRMALAMENLDCFSFLHRNNTVEERLDISSDLIKEGCRKFVVSLGLSELDEIDKFTSLGVNKFCLDVANGHSYLVREFINNFFWRYSDPDKLCYLVAGNYVTPGFCQHYSNVIYKVGIGNGSVCSTRLKTGIGRPQLSALMDFRNNSNVEFIADGGIKKPADFCKALATKASMVMFGGMFSGTDESETPDTYRGMASFDVMASLNKGKDTSYKTAEGVSVEAKRKGSVSEVVKDLLGGLASSMSYVDAYNLSEFSRNAKFTFVSTSSVLESSIHY